MSYIRDWDQTTPGDHTARPETPLKMREIKIDIAERLKDFFYGFISGETDTAAKQLTFKKQTSDPTNVADTAIIYAKEVSGVTEIFVRDSDGNIKQITSGGKLNIASDEAVLLTGDQTIAGDKILSGDTTFEGSVTHNNPTTFADTATFTNTATFNSTASFAEEATMSKTLNLQTSSKATNGYTYLPNGLILQWGVGDTATGAHSVSGEIYFPISFPNACFQVVVTPVNVVSGWAPPRFSVGSVSSSSFHYLLDPGYGGPDINNNCKLRFLAIGY